MTRAAVLWVVLGVGLGLVAVYGPHVAMAAFVYEDVRYAEASASPPVWRGRGLTYASWRVLNTPVASHALNLALHLIVVILAGVLVWQLVGSIEVAAMVATVLALHPLGLEGVAYAASRADLLSAVGVLLALVCVASRRAWTWAIVPLAMWVAYASKETGIVVAALVPLVLLMQGRRQLAGTLAVMAIVVGLVAVVVGAPTMEHGARIDLPAWALWQAAAVYRLVVLSVVPAWLIVSPDLATVTPFAGLCAVVLLVASLEAAWHLRVRMPLVWFGVGWCALVAAPRFLMRTPLSPFNEHQWYLALVGVACVWVALLREGVARWDAWRSWCISPASWWSSCGARG